MDAAGPYVAAAIFAATQIGVLIWVLGALKGESRVLKTQLGGMQVEIERQGKVLEALADVKAELKIMQERSLLQGKRIDEVVSRFNSHVDQWQRRFASRSSDQALEP